MNEHKVYHWDEEKRNIGVCVELKEGPKGPFFTFQPLRSYRRPGDEKSRYAHSFTEDQAEAFGMVVAWALNYIRENRPPEADLEEAA